MKKQSCILIIENSNLTRNMIVNALKIEGYEVVEAVDGKSALDSIQKKIPDLILQDLMLPDIEPADLVHQIKSVRGAEQVPIIAITGFFGKLIESVVPEIGYTAFLIKPIEPSYLLRVVSTFFPRENDPAVYSGEGKHILLADDDPLQMKLLKVQLEDAGYNVTCAVDGQDALQKAKTHSFDAIVSDILMPRVDGFELCLKLRLDKKLNQMPILLVTSHYLEEPDQFLAKKVGASGFIIRSFDPELFLKKLEDTLRIKPSRIDEDAETLFKEEHIHRLIRQLERQVIINTGLQDRVSLQAAQLIFLSEVTLAVIRKENLTTVLQHSLERYLDAAGINKALIFLRNQDKKFDSYFSVGYQSQESLKNFFNHFDLIEKVMVNMQPITIPSEDVDEDKAQSFLKRAGVATAFILPLTSNGEFLGVFYFGVQKLLVPDKDIALFLQVFGSQICQTLSLAHSFEESELRNKELVLEKKQEEGANKAKSTFLANMSHELRTPLNSIIGLSELMFRGDVGPINEVHKEYLGDILHSSQDLLKLLNDILDLSRVEAGRIEFSPETVDLKKIFCEVEERLKNLFDKKVVRFSYEIDSNLSDIIIDPARFKQILTNFISNAIKYTPNDGTIEIAVTSYDKNFFKVSVIDQGPGIRQEDLDKLFVEFSFLDFETAKQYHGCGLGLALTKKIVEAMRGRVGVKSEPGKGSNFFAILPYNLKEVLHG